ncbi:MAG: hypothetical protein ABIO39_08565 [Caulobacteraceae bacterium]
MTQTPHTAAPIIGLAALARLIYEGGDAQALGAHLSERIAADANDSGAFLDLGALVQLSGDRDNGLALQDTALGLNRLYYTAHGDGSGPRVLMLMVAGDMMANTPLDFLLESSNACLYSAYLDAAGRPPMPLPDHDVAFFGVGETAANQPILAAWGPVASRWPVPMLNADPVGISELTRDEVPNLFADEPSILSPITVRASRAQLAEIAAGASTAAALLDGADFPIIVRPTWSHAGKGLERIETPADLTAYLDAQADDTFFISPFIDYRSPDGLFRKQRIVFVGGRPHIAHMAISEHWMVHYLSAGMRENEARRAEEAAFMASFDDDFCQRHGEALAALNRKFGLDYFGIDCAETQDGRLLLFEADVAMIVHALDDEATFPYKKPAMARVFAAFHDLLVSAAERVEVLDTGMVA